MSERRRTPWYVWLIAGVLGLSQPLLILWITQFPPEGMVPTGLHIPDSAIFIQSMDMFENGFYSPYATAASEVGDHDLSFYPMPYLWMYGVLGVIAGILETGNLAVYGVANGVGVFLFLMVVYRFLREAVPQVANRAFLLFALSGGPAGGLFIITGLLGWHDSLRFDDYFFRFALYELMDGAHLLPVTIFPRLYYVVSLAFCLGGLTAFLKGLRYPCPAHLSFSGLLLFCGAFINPRFGVFTALIALLIAWRSVGARQAKLRGLLLFGVPGAAGWAAGWFLMRTNPAVIGNHLAVGNMAMWLSPFLTAAFLHLLVVMPELRIRARAMETLPRLVCWGGLAYLAIYTLLFAAHQVYYGNLLSCADGSVAPHVSDPALVGAVAAVLAAWWYLRRYGNKGITPVIAQLEHPQQVLPIRTDWIALWFLGFLALTLSAFGAGWFLKFGPQRLMVMLWLPLCMVAAFGLERLQQTRPYLAHGYAAFLVLLGSASVLVSLTCFQGPFDLEQGKGPYARFHVEVMTEADAQVLEALGEGRVLAFSPASDVVARHCGNPVYFGIGSFNLSRQPYAKLKAEVADFFEGGNEQREQLANEWGIEYVFYSDTWPAGDKTLMERYESSWLEEVASEDNAALFRVIH